MILNSAAGIAKLHPLLPLSNPIRASSTSSTEQLREELSHLHSEAENTRAKANSARLRLLRLSEAAEKLRRQAAISVRTGKEDDARDLLFQKKKVMQALEKSKSRIKLFDELSAKLNEAIYVKENQLIGNIDSDLAIRTEDTSSPVRIASSKQGAAEDSKETDFKSKDVKLTEYQHLQSKGEDHAMITNDSEQEAPSCSDLGSEDEIVNSMKGTSSYEDFMENLDNQLNIIEGELDTVLRASTVLLEGEDKQKNSRVQQIVELLDSIRVIRNRVSSFQLANANIR
ncbi:uncharacterized protein LOC111016762 [Momordica charantia]|uniref:Uncharacterized protein LOC111016762 n=1 Tax=Momordica charantia TaxID=3673 RepID=A0A6J1D2R5_MOMCH|nr:uncharacterized protein LOC111016762 [Momordica charantia]